MTYYDKQAHEMNKKELHKNIRWGAQEVRKTVVGNEYNYNVNSDHYGIRAVYDGYASELRSRGLTKTDQRVLDVYNNAIWDIEKQLEKLMP